MKNILLDESGDILIKGGKSFYIDGLGAYEQNLDNYLQTSKGEIFTDDTEGLPWFKILTNKSIDNEIKISTIKSAILTRNYIENIVDFSYEYVGSTRTLYVYATLETIDGLLEFKTGLVDNG